MQSFVIRDSQDKIIGVTDIIDVEDAPKFIQSPFGSKVYERQFDDYCCLRAYKEIDISHVVIRALDR